METIKGKIVQVYASNATWAAVRVMYREDGKEKQINASGKIFNPVKDTVVILEGDYFDDKTYGRKFIAEKCSLDEVYKNNSAVYLRSGLLKGVGPVLADRILAMFGNDAIRILDENPEALIKVKGITEKKLKKIIESHKSHSAMIELVNFFEGNITENQIKKIWEKYGTNSMKKIKQNPYDLIYDIDGFGFKKVDALALASGIDKDSHVRIGAALYFALVSAYQFGHCFLDINAIESAMLELIHPIPKWVSPKQKMFVTEWTDDNKEACRQLMIRTNVDCIGEKLQEIDAWHLRKLGIFSDIVTVLQKEIEANHIVIDGERIYTKEMYQHEVSLAQKVNKLLSANTRKIMNHKIDGIIEDSEAEQGFLFEKEQKLCIHAACQYPVNIITGGPGTGKSTILNTILKVVENENDCYLLAPTGKAAQRMQEVTGIKADTVHHFVYTDMYAGESIKNRSGNKRIFMDEASMADLPLVSGLFSKLNAGDYVTLIGDINQLPSIGAGNVLRDMIFSRKVPTTMLAFTHRFGGTIGYNAERINSGSSMNYLKFDDKFTFEEVPKEDITDKIVETYLALTKEYRLEDICCLVPVRKKGKSPSAVETINEIIREKLNPAGSRNVDLSIKRELFGFREGDRVMQMVNDHERETWTIDGDEDTGVYNGEAGCVYKADAEDGELIIRLDDGRFYACDVKQVQNLSLAYSTTIHKSQGSQYKVVIVVHNNEHMFMLSRNLFYTAVTRAKLKVCLLGDKKAFNWAMRNDKVADRNTFLISRIDMA